jgi:hypothetical protein
MLISRAEKSMWKLRTGFFEEWSADDYVMKGRRLEKLFAFPNRHGKQ